MRRASSIGVVLALVLLITAACQPTDGAWSGAASMATPRVEHAASLIPTTGRVLVTGGRTSTSVLRTAERYDPGTGQWTTVAPMSTPRAGHTSTALADGRILVAGGTSGASAEVFDGPSNRWTATAPMKRSRSGHRAVRLSSGRVLVAGGGEGAEVYDPATNTWSSTGALPTAVSVPDDTADTEYREVKAVDGLVALSSGRALAIVGHEILRLPNCPGVCGTTTTETDVLQYGAATNSWTLVPNMPLELADTTATRLNSGRVLVLGGQGGGLHEWEASSSAQVYDPATREWSTRSPMQDGRVEHTATLLADGRVLVAGGTGLCCDGPRSSTETYDPATLGFTPQPAMAAARQRHVAVRLEDGRVLVAGGDVAGEPSRTVEIFRTG
jgi:hypothetical protein